MQHRRTTILGLLAAGALSFATAARAQSAPDIVWQQPALRAGSGLAMSRDGTTLVASGDAIVVLDPHTGATLRTIADKAEAIAVSPAGDVIAAAKVTQDPTTGWWTASQLHLFDTDDGSIRDTLDEHKWQVWALAFSPDARTLATGDIMEELKLTDLASNSTLSSFPLQNRSVTFSPDSAYVVSNGQNSYARMYGTTTFKIKRVFQPWSGDVGVGFTPDGSRIVTSGTVPGGVNGVPASVFSAAVIKVFRVSDGTLLRAIKAYDNGGQQVRSFALSAEGGYAAVSLYGNEIRIYRLSDGALVRRYTQETTNVNGMLFTPDGMGFAYARADGTVIMARNPAPPPTPYPLSPQPLVPVAGPPPPTPVLTTPQPLVELKLSAEAVAGGQSASGTVKLAGAAPGGGQVVSLSSTVSAARVPASVTVPSGATTTTFAIVTTPVSEPQEGLIRAGTVTGEPRETGFKVMP